MSTIAFAAPALPARCALRSGSAGRPVAMARIAVPTSTRMSVRMAPMNASSAKLGAQRSSFKGAAVSAAPMLPARAGRARTVATKAAAGAAGGEGGGIGQTLLLGGFFGLWYLFNIFFNIYNKQVLKVFQLPFTCTNLQFGVGIVLVLLMWATKLHKPPTKEQLSKDTLSKVLILACVHTLGNLLTNVSLGKVAVSFTHTIKAMEPFFSVTLSSIFLGDAPSMAIIASLTPIVGGVALASMTEASFNWAGFLSAMGSNLTFQSRNVLSKKFMGGAKPMDNINLFSVITIMSFFVLAPFTLFLEGFKFTPAAMTAMGLDYAVVMKRAVLAGLCFHSYQQVSYMILQRVTPVTHSVGNCVKRVVVIIASVLFFKTPVSMLNGVGTAIALAGVFLYSQVKRAETAKAKLAKA